MVSGIEGVGMAELEATCQDCSWGFDGWELTGRNEATLRTKADRHERMREGHAVKVKAVW